MTYEQDLFNDAQGEPSKHFKFGKRPDYAALYGYDEKKFYRYNE